MCNHICQPPFFQKVAEEQGDGPSLPRSILQTMETTQKQQQVTGATEPQHNTVGQRGCHMRGLGVGGHRVKSRSTFFLFKGCQLQQCLLFPCAGNMRSEAGYCYSAECWALRCLPKGPQPSLLASPI